MVGLLKTNRDDEKILWEIQARLYKRKGLTQQKDGPAEENSQKDQHWIPVCKKAAIKRLEKKKKGEWRSHWIWQRKLNCTNFIGRWRIELKIQWKQKVK